MTAKQECEVLMNEVRLFAERMLREHGEFHPFGGTIQSDGRVALVGADTGVDMPPAGDLIEVLTGGFRRDAAAGNIRAAALVVNVSTVPPKQQAKVDAIRIALDHRDGYAVRVFFPYQELADAGLRIEPPFALPGISFVFGGESLA